MKQPINTLKNWFKTGLFPTQSQFWDWMDSYWHKDYKIPVSSIEGLSNVATKEDLDAAIQGVDNAIDVVVANVDGNTKGIDTLKTTYVPQTQFETEKTRVNETFTNVQAQVDTLPTTYPVLKGRSSAMGVDGLYEAMPIAIVSDWKTGVVNNGILIKLPQSVKDKSVCISFDVTVNYLSSELHSKVCRINFEGYSAVAENWDANISTITMIYGSGNVRCTMGVDADGKLFVFIYSFGVDTTYSSCCVSDVLVLTHEKTLDISSSADWEIINQVAPSATIAYDTLVYPPITEKSAVIADVNTRIDANKTQVASVQTQATANKTQIAGVQTQVTANKTQIDTLPTKYPVLKGRSSAMGVDHIYEAMPIAISTGWGKGVVNGGFLIKLPQSLKNVSTCISFDVIVKYNHSMKITDGFRINFKGYYHTEAKNWVSGYSKIDMIYGSGNIRCTMGMQADGKLSVFVDTFGFDCKFSSCCVCDVLVTSKGAFDISSSADWEIINQVAPSDTIAYDTIVSPPLTEKSAVIADVNTRIDVNKTQVTAVKTQVDKINSSAVFNILGHPGVNPGTFTSFAKWSNTVNNVGWNSQYIIGSQRTGGGGRGLLAFYLGDDDSAMKFTRFSQNVNKRMYVDQVTTATSLLAGDTNPIPVPNTLETFAWLSDLNSYLSKTATAAQTVASYVSFTAGAGSVSDERFKTNREPVTSVLEKIKAIPTFEYDWDRTTDELHRTLGVSAQDVQKQFPLLVKELDDVHHTLTVDYGKLAAIALAGLNEAHQRIEKLELLVEQLMSKK